ncbi:hypothetical protein ACXR2U_01235 [Jatrophihabitans sp. YIM 134969]
MSLRPVGNLPPSVYWRRRTLVVLPLLFLVILTFYVACSPGGSKGDVGASSPVASTSSVGSSPSNSAPTSPSPTTATTSGSAGAPTTTPTTTPPASPSAAAVTACVATSLQVAAVTSAKSYKVGSEPVVSLQVTNTGMRPCTQDLADRQIVLTVYNGDARVWGSHDCKVEPGTNVATLSPNRPVKLSITWTGLSSQPGCAAQRVRVAAGTYTLKATLGKITGVPATFALT